MFQVLDNGKPAEAGYFNVHKSWKTSRFDNFEDAQQYAWAWMGPPMGSKDGSKGVKLQLNSPISYENGHVLEILEIVETSTQ